MSQNQNAGKSHNVNIDNSSFQRVEQLKNLGTALTYQILSRKKLSEELNQGMLAIIQCRIFFLSLLSKNMKIKIDRTIILPDVFYGYETWSLTLREVCRLRVFEWIFYRTGVEAFVVV